MPRKSIFRRTKKKVDTQEEQTEETSLQRSSVDSSSLTIGAEIKSFNNTLSDDGTTLDISAADFATIELPKETVKPALKKERKTRRRKRKTKGIVQFQKLNELLYKLQKVDATDIATKFADELEKLEISQEAKKFINMIVEKIQKGEEIVDDLLDSATEKILKSGKIVDLVTPMINDFIKKIKETKTEITQKDDIFAKLRELEASRNVIIIPEQIKEEPKPAPKKKEKKDDIMAKLKELELARNKEIKPVAKVQPKPKPVIKEMKAPIKPIAKAESNEKILLNNKTYNIKIKLQKDDNNNVILNLLNDNDSDIPLHIKINTRKKELSVHEMADGKWSRITKGKLKNDNINIKLRFDRSNIHMQVVGIFQQNIKRQKNTLINKCLWTMKNITIS